MYPEHLKYTKEHEWIDLEEDGTARVGITDYAQHELGDIVYVELPAVDDDFETGEAFGVVESVKAVSDLYMPVSCKVKEVNGELENQPELINHSPHDDGWIVRIELTDKEEVAHLMDAEEYIDFLATIAEKSGSKKKKAKKGATEASETDHNPDDDTVDDDDELDGYSEDSQEAHHSHDDAE
jgi:glycine cleavage system H protein